MDFLLRTCLFAPASPDWVRCVQCDDALFSVTQHGGPESDDAVGAAVMRHIEQFHPQFYANFARQYSVHRRQQQQQVAVGGETFVGEKRVQQQQRQQSELTVVEEEGEGQSCSHSSSSSSSIGCVAAIGGKAQKVMINSELKREQRGEDGTEKGGGSSAEDNIASFVQKLNENDEDSGDAEKRASAPKKYIKRPLNAFMLWSFGERLKIRKACPRMNGTNISKILGTQWKEMSSAEKQPYYEEHLRVSKLHKENQEYRNYKPPRIVKHTRRFVNGKKVRLRKFKQVPKHAAAPPATEEHRTAKNSVDGHNIANFVQNLNGESSDGRSLSHSSISEKRLGDTANTPPVVNEASSQAEKERFAAKPPFSKAHLFLLALANGRPLGMSVGEIYDFLRHHFPYYRHTSTDWRKWIRTTLVRYKDVKRVDREASERVLGGGRLSMKPMNSCLWQLLPERRASIVNELNAWRAQAEIKQHILNAMEHPENVDKLFNGKMGMPSEECSARTNQNDEGNQKLLDECRRTNQNDEGLQKFLDECRRTNQNDEGFQKLLDECRRTNQNDEGLQKLFDDGITSYRRSMASSSTASENGEACNSSAQSNHVDGQRIQSAVDGASFFKKQPTVREISSDPEIVFVAELHR